MWQSLVGKIWLERYSHAYVCAVFSMYLMPILIIKMWLVCSITAINIWSLLWRMNVSQIDVSTQTDAFLYILSELQMYSLCSFCNNAHISQFLQILICLNECQLHIVLVTNIITNLKIQKSITGEKILNDCQILELSKLITHTFIETFRKPSSMTGQQLWTAVTHWAHSDTELCTQSLSNILILHSSIRNLSVTMWRVSVFWVTVNDYASINRIAFNCRIYRNDWMNYKHKTDNQCSKICITKANSRAVKGLDSTVEKVA